VPAIGGGAHRAGRQIRDQRLLAPLHGGGVDAVEHEPADEGLHRLTPRESGIDHRVQEPAGNDEGLAADAIRQRTALH